MPRPTPWQKLPTCWTPPPRKRYATRRCYLARQGSGYPENRVPLNVFREAIRNQAKLHIDYADASQTQSQRLIWPLALGFLNEVRVIVAWCELRDAYRTFRTDRVAAAESRGERYPGRRSDWLRAGAS